MYLIYCSYSHFFHKKKSHRLCLFVADSVLLHALSSLEDVADEERENSAREDRQGDLVDGASEINISEESPRKESQ